MRVGIALARLVSILCTWPGIMSVWFVATKLAIVTGSSARFSTALAAVPTATAMATTL